MLESLNEIVNRQSSKNIFVVFVIEGKILKWDLSNYEKV